jgi:hypothetical protein
MADKKINTAYIMNRFIGMNLSPPPCFMAFRYEKKPFHGFLYVQGTKASRCVKDKMDDPALRPLGPCLCAG